MSSSKDRKSSNFTYSSSMGNPSSDAPDAASYQYYPASMFHANESNNNNRNDSPYDYDNRRYSSLRAEYEEQYLHRYHRPMDDYARPARPLVPAVAVDHLINQSPIKRLADESEKIQYPSRTRCYYDMDAPAFAGSSGSSLVASSYCSDRKMKAGKMIEVSPGQFLRLRGAEETWKAIHRDFFMPCGCLCCDLTIFCIQDADCVLCPICKTINPMDYSNGEGEGGVGLGFTMEDLRRWQDEIDCGRKLAQKKKQFC